MPRNRKADTETATDTIQKENKVSQVFSELDNTQLDELLASSRSKGEYDRQLISFVKSDMQAAKINLEEGVFKGKKAPSIKTGFEGAIKREGAPEGSKDIRVVLQGESVYLVRRNEA